LRKVRKKRVLVEDIAKFAFDAVISLIEVIENVKGLTGEQKKEVVLSSVKEIYYKVNPTRSLSGSNPSGPASFSSIFVTAV